MTENAPEIDSCIRTANGFCAELAEDSQTSSLALDDLRRRIDEHRETHDDPRLALTAVSVACGYATRAARRSAHDGLALGEWTPGWIDVEHDSMLVCPPPLDRIDHSIRDTWAELAHQPALHPLVRARIADLLNTLKHNGTPQFAEIAADGYLETLTDTTTHETERITALKRIASLCHQLQDTGLLRIVDNNTSATHAHRNPRQVDGSAIATA